MAKQQLPPHILTKIEQDTLLPAMLASARADEWFTITLCGATQGTETRKIFQILDKPGNAEWVAATVADLKRLGFKDSTDSETVRKDAPLILIPDPRTCTVTINAKAEDVKRALELKQVFAATFVSNDVNDRKNLLGSQAVG